MSGDFTRSTFDPGNNYSAVLHEAGGLVVDADLNEQRHISLHDIRQARIDIIGRAGAPQDAPGLEITPVGGGLQIEPGRYYLEGIRVDWPQALSFVDQPHAPELPTEPGLYLAVLHVWERPVDAISDPSMREVALGGAAPSIRTQVVAQIELLPVTSESTTPTCATEFPEWDELLGAVGPRMQVRLSEGTSDDPCSIPEDAGYRGLENRLYRMEVHNGNFADPAATPTFKWSRDNGSVVASWVAHDGGVEVTVDRLGPGGTQGFAPGNRVELTHDGWILAEQPGLMAVVHEVGANVLTLEDPGGTLGAELAAAFAGAAQPRLRRWDSAEVRPLEVTPPELGVGDVTPDGWIRIESGLEVRFEDGVARPGMYWELPARTAALPGTDDRQLDWPIDPATNEYASRPADGPAHHYGRLAVLSLDGSGWSVIDDCRPTFPPLTDLPQAGGDGGCGEVAIEPGTDVVSYLLARELARLDGSGALSPAPSPASDSLSLCFRPGDHAIGNLAFSAWRSLRLTGTNERAVTLHGRIRARRCSNVELRGLGVIDRGLEGERIAAVDDDGDFSYRWRTRVIEVREITDAVTIERVHVDYSDPRWQLKDGQAIHVGAARDVRVRDCVLRVPRGQNGLRIQDVDRAIIEDNRLRQDWGRRISLDSLSGPERRELDSWVGRLLFDIDSIYSRTEDYRAFFSHRIQPERDRRAYRVGFGPGDQRHWSAHATVLGFSRQRLTGDVTAVRAALRDSAATLMENLDARWNFREFLPAGISTAPADLRATRHTIQHRVQTRRARLGRSIVSRRLLGPMLRDLRDQLIDNGWWLVGLGGTGIRVAITGRTDSLPGAISIRGNWVEDFAVGIAATMRQAAVGQAEIQRIDVVDNALRLHSPLIPVQRGGVIAGGARRIRVDNNDIDVREGSSHSLNRSRGWFVGVDGIRLRGRAGAWVGARGNHVRGCAVGLRSMYSEAPEPLDDSPTRVDAIADNAFVGCDFDLR